MNKGEQRIVLKNYKYIPDISTFMQTRYKDINFWKTFKIWVRCAISRTQKNWYEYRILLSHSIFRRIGLNIWMYISAWNKINFRLRVSFSTICPIRFSSFFLDIIPSLSVFERNLYDKTAFIISDTVWFHIFLSQVDWISEKLN